MNDSRDTNLINWIQDWYYQYCNGDWEHNEHFSIRNIDNPGWRVSINLEDTHCEGEKFESIDVEKDTNDWYQCFLRDGKFEGAGGPSNLVDILERFRDWAIKCQENH